jgi:hypothetical protein
MLHNQKGSDQTKVPDLLKVFGGVTKSVIGAGAGSSGWWLYHCPCLVCDQQTDEESARRTLETYADLVSLESPEFDRGMKAVV